ncbi:hypothetical protein J1N35_037609 [Gossypium stocksii]|uniref:CCHC-type domain-containing protein n=1 Tax=Gossypium stocksii TaxID=47602 RepID=A0A9D3UK57_9ROSI|nr:hypothetical protein J1N35_037609 [Gossypium stocksii]
MEGQSWLLWNNIIIFDRLIKPMDRSQIKLLSTPFWTKTGPYSPEFDKKDLLHAIGVTFGGIIRSEIIGEFCRLRVKLDVQKPLAFKYEKLPAFCFGCGKMGHGLQECKFYNLWKKTKLGMTHCFL